MAIAFMPGTFSEMDIADLGKPEAAPLSAGRQMSAASAGKLVGQSFLLSLGMAEDYRTELARIAVIRAKDLLATA